MSQLTHEMQANQDGQFGVANAHGLSQRSEEHTSELQSLAYLVCRLLLEKKKKNKIYRQHLSLFYFFFFNDTATTEIYTLSLHDALPISATCNVVRGV